MNNHLGACKTDARDILIRARARAFATYEWSTFYFFKPTISNCGTNIDYTNTTSEANVQIKQNIEQLHRLFDTSLQCHIIYNHIYDKKVLFTISETKTGVTLSRVASSLVAVNAKSTLSSRLCFF